MSSFEPIPMPSDIGDLTVAALMMVKNRPEVIELVEEGIIGEGPGASDGMWVFPGTLQDNKPFRSPLNTSQCAVVLSTWTTWGYSDYHSNNFPILQVSIYADSTRTTGTTDISKYDAHSKAMRIYRALDPLFHDVGNQHHDWFGTQIISSRRYSGPNIGEVPGQNDGLYIMNTRYSVITM